VTARNLGVQIDEQMPFDSQSRSCAKACYYHLRRIRQIRKYVDDEVSEVLCTSRLDYCNSLYAYSSVSTRQRLQHVQNCAARLVADAPRRASSRPLHQLHWLHVEARITYKLCTLLYRIFNGTVPQYLAELCQLCSDDRLQSSLHQDYVVPRTCKHLADSSFSVAGPRLLHETLYRSNFVAHSLTARFVAVLKHFYGRPM